MKRRRWIFIGGVAAAVALIAVGLTLALRPARAESRLKDAMARWEAAGPATYRLRLTQQTRRGACDQEMVTRDGKAAAVRNTCGQPANWTVPRLFSWIAELEHDPVQCYPDRQMCACKGSTTTTVRYDDRRGYPVEIVYEWRKQPNLTDLDYWRSLFDQSFPGCNRDGRGGQVVVSVSLTDEQP